MAKSKILNIRIDPDLKKKAKKLADPADRKRSEEREEAVLSGRLAAAIQRPEYQTIWRNCPARSPGRSCHSKRHPQLPSAVPGRFMRCAPSKDKTSCIGTIARRDLDNIAQ